MPTLLSAHSPFPGLRPFDRPDADYFFGREAQVMALRERVMRPFTAVIGDSGSGKSSLVRAGLLPQLGEMTNPAWSLAVIRPESTPYENLAAALDFAGSNRMDGEAVIRRSRLLAILNGSSDGLVEAVRDCELTKYQNFLLVVDQFEELIRDDQADLDTSLNFIQLLLAAVKQRELPIHILITLRLDFLGDCARYRGLTEAINEGPYLVPALDHFQRIDAISKPVKKGNKQISWDLLQTLLNEVDDAQDQLPALQHCLMRVWEVGDDAAELSMKHYHDQRVESLAVALAKHADLLFESLSKADQDLMKRLLKAITDFDMKWRGVRRPMRIVELIPALGLDSAARDPVGVPVALRRVIDCFRDEKASFLLPPKRIALDLRTKIDIAHECLIRQWPRICGTASKEGWLHEEEADGRKFTQIVSDALGWHQSKKRPYSSDELQDISKWRRSRGHLSAWGMRYIRGNLRKRLFLSLDLSEREISQDAIIEGVADARQEQNKRFAAIDSLIDGFLADCSRPRKKR